jgi:DNA-binding NarL/FixJ family response regulator
MQWPFDKNRKKPIRSEVETEQLQPQAPQNGPEDEAAEPERAAERVELTVLKAEAKTPPRVNQAEEASAVSKLSPRERQVFGLLCEGAKLNGIAEALGIKFSTVNTHQKSIYKKLGVNTRAECIIRYRK